ncbi:MAG: hypothetical protein RLZZ535_683 [Cyanobacteriota bacterium]|jgi:hypothetical protein
MATIRTLCANDPAVAIKAMIDGLMTYKLIQNFQLDFITFGTWENNVCYGCSATITLIRLLNLNSAPIQLGNEVTRARLIPTSLSDLLDFEKAIDMFRRGSFSELEEYFELPISPIFCVPWYCHGGNLSNQLPKIIKFWEDFTGQKYKSLTSKGFSVYESPKNESKKDFYRRWTTAVAANSVGCSLIA